MQFTFKQFIYLLGGGAGCFALYKILPIYLAIPLMIAVAGFALALTFYKVNDRPFVMMLESAFNYYIGNKLYVWKQHKPTQQEYDAKKAIKAASDAAQQESTMTYIPRLSNSKLKDLSWSLDVLDMEKRKQK